MSGNFGYSRNFKSLYFWKIICCNFHFKFTENYICEIKSTTKNFKKPLFFQKWKFKFLYFWKINGSLKISKFSFHRNFQGDPDLIQLGSKPQADEPNPSAPCICHLTVLQDGQFAALRNKCWSLNFLQILMIFSTKIPNFVNFWPIFY